VRVVEVRVVAKEAEKEVAVKAAAWEAARVAGTGEATVVEPAAMQVAIPAVVMESEPMVVVGMVAEARAEEVTDVAVRVVLQEVARGAEMVEGTEVVATVVAGMAAVVTAAAIEPLST
jgi:hypothetical protein